MKYNEEIIRGLFERADKMLPREFSNSLTDAEKHELDLFYEPSTDLRSLTKRILLIRKATEEASKPECEKKAKR